MPDLDLNKLMEMAQNAQAELQKATQSLETIEVEGAAGGGLVKVRATAKGRSSACPSTKASSAVREGNAGGLDRRRDQ